jgi:Ca-activated chloride channel family protein
MTDDDKMTDDALYSLNSLRTAAPSPEAKKIALNAAMAAFDVAHQRKPMKSGWFSRWAIGAGFAVPLTTAVAALVLFPVGTQLLTATSNHADGVPPVSPDVTIASVDEPAKKADDEAKQKDVDTSASTTTLTLQKPVAPPKEEQLAQTQGTVSTTTPTTGQERGLTDQLVAEPAPSPAPFASRDVMSKTTAMPSTVAPMTEAAGEADLAMAPAANATALAGYGAPSNIVPMQPPGDQFKAFDENRVKITKQEPVSTFSIDVDTASYSYVRSLLKDGYLPDPNAVRIEEMINYFPYDYPAPTSLDTPFKSSMAIIPTPWNSKTQLLEIGIKGYVPPATERTPQNLTFLIDTSGSMDEPNKLPLLKRSFGLLVDTLRPDDTVSIVTYAGSAGVALKPTKAKDRTTILQALEAMYAEGSTDGVDGIALAYRVNAEAESQGTTNRVILATDGDFNVGISDPDELKAYIKTERNKGIFLSVLGFGRGNLDDELMQSLAQNGNGNASYIDSFSEAQKVLVAEGGANLLTIAKDVKIQVEFNPAVVSEYRLIGYETRALNREDFNNDTVDAGEIGAGHTVTAIYEITPVGSGADLNDPLRYSANITEPTQISDEIGFLKMRYKAPDGDVSKLISTPITKDLAVTDISQATTDQRFAASVAAFGQKLKGSSYGETLTWDQISALANGAKGADADGYRGEFVQLIKLASVLNPDHSAGGRSVSDDPNGGKSTAPPPSVN